MNWCLSDAASSAPRAEDGVSDFKCDLHINTCRFGNFWLEPGISQEVSLANVDSQYDRIRTKPH